MTLNFPNAPTADATHTTEGATYRYVDGRWVLLVQNTDLAASPPTLLSVAIIGTGVIGDEHTLDIEVDGSPTPGLLTVQWTRGGANISGATSAAYTPTFEDNLTQLGVHVVVSNVVGTDDGVQDATVAIVWPAPIAAGGIDDQNYTEGVAIAPLYVSEDFTGDEITYALAPTSDPLPDGLTLSGAGVLTGAPTEDVVDAVIVVRGTNSGGFDDSAFEIDVAAASAVSNQPASFGALTLAGAGGFKPLDSEGAEVDLVAVTDQTGASNTWSIASGRLVCDAPPAGDDDLVVTCSHAGGSVEITIALVADTYSALTNETEIDAVFDTIGTGGGVTVLLRPGLMAVAGNLFRDRLFTSEVILEGEQPAIVGGEPTTGLVSQMDYTGTDIVRFRNAHHLTLHQIAFTASVVGQNPVTISHGSSNLDFQDCHIRGVELDPDGDYSEGYTNALAAFYITDTGGVWPSNITLQRSLIEHALKGINAGCEGYLRIRHCHIRNTYSDTMTLSDPSQLLTELLIEGNLLDGMISDADSGTHNDAIQLIVQDGPSSEYYWPGIVVRGNIIIPNGTTGSLQGLFNGAGDSLTTYDAPKIYGNIILNSHTNSITLGRLRNPFIVGNILARIGPNEPDSDGVHSSGMHIGMHDPEGLLEGTEGVIADNISERVPSIGDFEGVVIDESGNVVLGNNGSTIAYTTAFDGPFPVSTRAEVLSAFATKAAGPAENAGPDGTGVVTFGDLMSENGWDFNLSGYDVPEAGGDSEPEPVTVDSASLRFPISNLMVAAGDQNYIELANVGLEGAGNVQFWNGDCAFMATISIPTREYAHSTDGISKNTHGILGNASTGALSRSIGLFLDTTEDDIDAGHELRMTIRGVISHSAEIGFDDRDILVVFRQVDTDAFVEYYRDGALLDRGTYSALAADRLRLGFMLGCVGGGASAPAISGSLGGFHGSIGFVGFSEETVTEADCLAISAGADPETQIASWRYGLKLTDETDVVPFADSLSVGNATAVGSGFRKGGDIVPTRSGSDWFKLNPVHGGQVWSVEPGEDTAKISVSGAASGLTGGVEIQYFDADGTLRLDWTLLDGVTLTGATPEAWAGVTTVASPKGVGHGYINARPVAAPSMVSRDRNECGVGYDILFLGQSEVARCFEFGSTLDLTPSSECAVSVIREEKWSGAGSMRLTMGALTADRPFSDGVGGAADYIASVTDAPVRLIDAAVHGTGPFELVDDSDTDREWDRLAYVVDTAGLVSGVMVMMWGNAILNQPDLAGNYLDPLVHGDAPTTEVYDVDHYIYDGVTFPLSMGFCISPQTPQINATTGPTDEQIADNQGSAMTAMYNEYKAWCDSEGRVFGPDTNDIVVQSGGGSHQDPNSIYGHPRTIIRSLQAAFRQFGIATATDPTLGTAVRSGDTITIPATLPNGGTLQTAWSIAGVTPPADWPTVQGFEVSEDGGTTWSNGNTTTGTASPEFTAEISGSDVVLTRASGSWAAGTLWRYAAQAPLNYGSVISSLGLVHGLLYEGDGDGLGSIPELAAEGGIGLPMRRASGTAA